MRPKNMKTEKQICLEIGQLESRLLHRSRTERFRLVEKLQEEIKILNKYLKEDDDKISELLKILKPYPKK